jgi:hypothetical protein
MALRTASSPWAGFDKSETRSAGPDREADLAWGIVDIEAGLHGSKALICPGVEPRRARQSFTFCP